MLISNHNIISKVNSPFKTRYDLFCRLLNNKYPLGNAYDFSQWEIYIVYIYNMLHMSFMITSEYNNYLVIFVEYNISIYQYCDVKYYEFNILCLKNNYPGVYALIHIHTYN